MTMTSINERQRARFFIYKKQKHCDTFLYTKSQKFFTKKDYLRSVLYTKIQTLYVTQFFMKNLNLAFLYKKDDTFRYVKFLYTKI